MREAWFVPVEDTSDFHVGEGVGFDLFEDVHVIISASSTSGSSSAVKSSSSLNERQLKMNEHPINDTVATKRSRLLSYLQCPHGPKLISNRG